MRNHLLFFTVSYPYENGETFIKNELEILSKEFDRITLIPMNGVNETRSVPDNVNVLKPLWGSKKERYLFYLKNIFCFRTLSLFLNEWIVALVRERRFHVAVAYRILLWSIYRSALEKSNFIKNVKSSPDDIVAYSYWGQTCALAIPKLSSMGIPCAIRYHRVDLYLDGFDNSSYIHRHAKYLPWREVMDAASKLSIFISEQGRAYYRKQWPLATVSKKILGRLGVSSRDSTPEKNEEKLIVVSCSFVSPIKRVDKIASFVRELSNFTRVEWHHFGSGELEHIEFIMSGASSNVDFKLWGWVDNNEVLDFYVSNHVDLFLNFSTGEGVPVSIMEAISCNIPAVATDVGGTSEAVISGKSGLLIDKNECDDLNVLAQKVTDELAPGGLIAQSRPRDLWNERFNAQENYSKLAHLLKNLDNELGTNP